MRYEGVKRRCPKVFVCDQTHGNAARAGASPAPTILRLQLTTLAIDDICDTRYEGVKRRCSQVFVSAQAHGNGVL